MHGVRSQMHKCCNYQYEIYNNNKNEKEVYIGYRNADDYMIKIRFAYTYFNISKTSIFIKPWTDILL